MEFDDFVTHYNTSTLSDKECAKLYKSARQRNDVVAQQLLVHHRSKIPYVSEITGPCSLTKHKVQDKTIYIYGENHGLQNGCSIKCPTHSIYARKQCVSPSSKLYPRLIQQGYKPYLHYTIDDYLYELFTKTDVFIDFYIELSPTKMFISEPTSYLQKIRNRFINAFPDSETYDPYEYPLVRMHPIDTRWNRYVSNNDLGHIDTFINKLRIYEYNDVNDSFTNEEEKDKIVDILTKLSDSFRKTKKYIISIIHAHRTHEIESIHLFIDEKISHLYNTNQHLIKQISTDLLYLIDNHLPNTYSNLFVRYTEIFTDFEAMIMDENMLLSLYRIMPTNPQYQRTIIIYVGEYHANMYRNFLSHEIGRSSN